MWSSMIAVWVPAGKTSSAPTCRPRRAAAPRAPGSSSPRGDPRAPVGDVVEQDHVPDLARVGGRIRPRPAQRAVLEVAVACSPAGPPRRRRGRSGSRGGPRAARTASVRASSIRAAVPAALSLAPTNPFGWYCGVVVGADQDRRGSPGQHTDDVPEALLRPGAREGLEGRRPGSIGAKLRRELTKLRRARGSRPDRDLAAGRATIAAAPSKLVRREEELAAAAPGEATSASRPARAQSGRA